MFRQFESEFLAAGNTVGSWWVPQSGDWNDDGDLDPLPERSETGVFSTANDGEYRLLLASASTTDDKTKSASPQSELVRREVTWGATASSSVSLFDATQTNSATDHRTYRHEVWRGPWHVDSQTDWFRPTDRIERIHIEIGAALRWADLPPGEGNMHGLHHHWDRKGRIFTRPQPVIHDSTVNGANVQLRTRVSVHETGDEVNFRLATDFTVTDDVTLSEVLRKWVEPLHDLMGLFWLKNPGIVTVSVQRPDSLELSQLGYSGRFAPVEQSQVIDTAPKLAPFASAEGLAARGYTLDDLLNGYWNCRAQGFGRAMQRLNESQDSHLDHSLDARMLSAVKSLESLEQARRGRSGSVNIAAAAGHLIDSTGAVGDDINDIWAARGKQLFKNSIAQIRNQHLAHEQDGTRLKTRSDDEIAHHYWHHIALQWLLRRRLLGLMGIADPDADDLTRDSLAYKEMITAMRRQLART